MNLEVGMYVKTKKGYIYKLSRYEEDNNRWISFEENDWYPVYESLVTKASHNIIDLIEVGDIIKFDITDTDNYAEIQGYNCWEISCEEELNGVKEMIEMESAKLLSIVTKEQFESIEYNLEG